MSRPLRIEYAGAVYHVMARGNRGLPIFQNDQDRRRFLETMVEACKKTGWWVHAYVLMGNHYHLLLETPEDNLVADMKWLQRAYAQRCNSPGYFEVVGTNIHYFHEFRGSNSRNRNEIRIPKSEI